MRLVVLAVVLVLAGCASSRRAETVRVPVEGNAWIGSIIPRLHRAGLRIAIPETWGASSFGTPMALLGSPVAGTRVRFGTVETLRMTMLGGLATESLGRHVVPDVRGATLRRATAAIEAAQLAWGFRAGPLPPTATGDLYASYCVTSQRPAAGTGVTFPTSGSRIWLVELRARPC
jgi:hypothetical protein